MPQIIVTRQADGTFRVQTPAGTSHEVSVPAGFAASFGGGNVALEELVRASFEFLLEREPATSILRTFSLEVISQYFPSYPAEMRARLGNSDPGMGSGRRLPRRERTSRPAINATTEHTGWPEACLDERCQAPSGTAHEP